MHRCHYQAVELLEKKEANVERKKDGASDLDQPLKKIQECPTPLKHLTCIWTCHLFWLNRRNEKSYYTIYDK